jgi:glycosyltransferase involved in cell wall biosynthesis
LRDLAGESALANRIWIDVEDLFIYARLGLRPSGIQRLEFELCRALVAIPQSQKRVFFVRHDADRQCLVATRWEAVEEIFGVMSGQSQEGDAVPKCSPNTPECFSKKPGADGRIAIRTLARSALRKALRSLPLRLRKIIVAQIEVFIGVNELMHAVAGRAAAALRRRRRLQRSASGTSPTDLSYDITDDFAVKARAGDILAVLGAAWITPDFGAYIERAMLDKGLRLALLVYDTIPLRRPEWFNEKVVDAVRTWFDGALPLAHAILTISAATARDVSAYALGTKLALRGVPTPIPIGSGFKSVSQRSPSRAALNGLPPPNSYALIVSTIEVRKNHALLFQIWRRLLEDMPAELVPTLVFAGRVGWLVSDLMEQLRNSRFLNGKIVHIESPTDEELEALYDGCLFTLYPSFYEGWGLPVTESLAFGRPCIISKATSLPEAGGSLARYIDPDNITDAYRVIRETIEDQAGLRSWRERVRREFKPVEWSQSARGMLKLLDTIEDVSWETETRHCAHERSRSGAHGILAAAGYRVRSA